MVDREKALIIGVGTGVGGVEGTQNLARGLLFSIKNHHPDRICFVVTRESQEKTLPLIREKDGRPNETILVEDEDDIEGIYALLKRKIELIRNECPSVTVDYTSGTKAMTAALAIVGTLFNVDALSYVAGKRAGGIVVPGTEKLHVVQPFFDYSERRIREATEIFNLHRYDAVLDIITDLKEECRHPDLLARVNPMEVASRAYANWDNFSHQQAYRELSNLKLPDFDANKAFLGRLVRCLEQNAHADRTHPEDKNKLLGILNPNLDRKILVEAQQLYLADIISSAARRATTDAKYDDAVARLYRAVELIAQLRLFNAGITNTSQVDLWCECPSLARQWNIPSGDKKTRLALDRCFALLAARGDKLGDEYGADKALKDSLSKRNFSILAHGLKPISLDEYRDMHQRVEGYAAKTVTSFAKLVSEATFIPWPLSPR